MYLDSTEAKQGCQRHSVRFLTAYKTGIQAARYCRIIRAFDDGPAVGKKGHLVRIAPEFQHESIVFDRAMCAEPRGHLGKIDGAMTFVDLNRVPAAQRNLRAALTRQMNEFM